MKFPRLLLLLTLLAATGFAFKKAPLAEVIIQTHSYCDHFEKCESGKSRLEKELMLSAGVKEVSVDTQTMKVTVKYNPKSTSPEKIRKVISEAGYDADDVKADPKGYEKLDNCCKKKE